jgi:PilZ domain
MSVDFTGGRRVAASIVPSLTFYLQASSLLAKDDDMSGHDASEVFLCFPLASQRLEELCGARLAVDGAAARVMGVDLYYRASTDVALVGVRLDAQTVTPALRMRLADETEEIGGAILEPGGLEKDDRDKFYRNYLKEYPMRIADFPTVGDAFRLLARNLGQPMGHAPPTTRGLPLQVRFRRGDEWILGRPRHLSREGIYVTTSAPPRRGDLVELWLGLSAKEAVLRAQVVHVTREDAAAAVGGAGFGARFLLDKPEERQHLEGLVRGTRQDGLHGVCATPARREVRYPVRWPVSVKVGGGAASTSALDVSWHGMFLAGGEGAQRAKLDLVIPVDDDGDPVRCGGRVARVISEETARARGMVSGIGLELADFPSGDDVDRFHGFVSRVGRRAALSVVVAAAEGRAAELASQLASVGYAAHGVSVPKQVMQLSTRRTRPDLVVVDHSFDKEHGTVAKRVRHALDARNIKALPLDEGLTLDRVRSLADQALL